MTEWFRSWHGAPTDPKWRTIARRAGVRPGDVTALVWVLLDRASQATPRGSIAGYDAEVLADALGFEEAQITAIIDALHEKNVLDDDAFSSWEKHQPLREDDSAARAKAYRERMKRESEEAERNRTQPNATDQQIRGEEIREDKKEGSSLRSEPRVRDAKPKADDDWPDDYDAQFWTLWPNKVGKPDALKSLARLRKRGVPFRRIIEGEERYIRDKPPDRPWLNPATFLNQARYDDEPATTIAKTHVFRGNADDKRTAWLAALDGKPAGPDYLDGDYEVVDPYAGQPMALAR